MVETKAERNVNDKDVKEKEGRQWLTARPRVNGTPITAESPGIICLSCMRTCASIRASGASSAQARMAKRNSRCFSLPPGQVSSPHPAPIRVRAFLRPHAPDVEPFYSYARGRKQSPRDDSSSQKCCLLILTWIMRDSKATGYDLPH